MVYRLTLLIVFLLILQGCSSQSQEVNLSSGVQFIGEDEKILSKLQNIEIDYQNSLEIDIEAIRNKLVFIEPDHIKDISKEDVETALEKGYYVFFINMNNDKSLREKFFSQNSYEVTKDEKTWVEQIYIGDDGLTSLNISTKGNIYDNLSRWLTVVDKFKKESK